MRRWLERSCGVVAALALFAIMALTVVDVAGRKALDNSVPGSLELTELLMVLVIFSQLPLVSLRGEHVVFDSLDPLLPHRLKRVQQGVIDVLCALAMFGLAALMFDKAGQMLDFGDTTAQLKIPQGPFVYLMSALCLLNGVVHLMLLAEPVAPNHGVATDAPTTGAT